MPGKEYGSLPISSVRETRFSNLALSAVHETYPYVGRDTYYVQVLRIPPFRYVPASVSSLTLLGLRALPGTPAECRSYS